MDITKTTEHLNIVPLTKLRKGNVLSPSSPIPIISNTTEPYIIENAVNLNTLSYIFKDRTYKPYGYAIKLNALSDSLTFILSSPYSFGEINTIISFPSGKEVLSTYNIYGTPNYGTITFETDDFNPIKECYITGDFEWPQSFQLRTGTINNLDLTSCNEIRTVYFQETATAKLNELDLRGSQSFNIFEIIGDNSYVNKLYYYNVSSGKSGVLLNLRNSRVYNSYISSGTVAPYIQYLQPYTNPVTFYFTGFTKSEFLASDLEMAESKNIRLVNVL